MQELGDEMPKLPVERFKIVGIGLFTLIYVFGLVAYRRFLSKTPEAREGIYLLALLSTIVYVVGVLVLFRISGVKTTPADS